jgi:hypothetical protein
MDEQTKAVIGQLQQQLQAQQELLARQQRQQESLYAQMAQQAASASSSPPTTSSMPVRDLGRPLVKPRTPSTFMAGDGIGELDRWEREMRYQFAAYGPSLGTPEARIAFAVSYLGPVPLQWWDADPSHRMVGEWEPFVKLLRARFSPLHAAKQARIELFKIKQSPSQSAGAYAAVFQQLVVSLPDMHVDDQVFLFVRGLLPALKRRVGDKEFATLSAAINAAVQSEGLYGAQAGDVEEPPTLAPSHSPMDINALSADTFGSGFRPGSKSALEFGQMAAQLMDAQTELHALRAEAESSKWTKELEDRKARGACFGCGLVGHRRIDCPRRK